jgi:hypothetical protein
LQKKIFYRLAHEGKDKKTFNSFGRAQTNEQKQLFLVRRIIFLKFLPGFCRHQPQEVFKCIQWRKQKHILNAKT